MATRFLFIAAFIVMLAGSNRLLAQNPGKSAPKSDSLHYPLQDRRGDRFSWRNNNPFNINDTALIKQNIEYNPATNQYIITEKIGNTVYRTPMSMSFEDFWKLQNQAAEEDYFSQRSEALSMLNRQTLRPKPHIYNKLFDRIFGVGPNGLKVDIKPEGSVNLKLGYTGQHVKNPTLPERAQRNGGLDFDMNSNVNVNASIGDKLKLPINYNTQANFDYENQLKLDYKGMDDELIKSVEAGNVSFQTKSTLMSSVQSLFGIKTQLQFGKLMITTAIANQRSQRQSVTLQGGGLTTKIDKKLDDYDENRNFLMGQYFRKNFNKAMANLPVINSQVQILRLEVWVTNRTGTVSNTRAIVGLMDLGEDSPYNANIHPSLTTSGLPDNGSNDLYNFLAGNKANRDPTFVNTTLQQRGLTPVEDYEKTFARKLDPSEYYYTPKVGFLCLRQQLQPNDVLAVAYQYTYNGRVYQVGEFSQDVTVDSTSGVQKVLFLKLLKATSQRPALPIWQLMMKNVYTLDVTTLQQDGFNVNVMYQEPSGGTKRYLPESSQAVSGKSLISILNLDRLNFRNDPAPDGQFDYVDSFTVLSQQGKIIFPVLEPFGNDLRTLAFAGVPDTIANKYVYQQLYDSIKAIAQTYANLDHYLLQGTIKGASNSQVYLGGFNIPPGSVTVTAGGQTLIENQDYTIDYNLGTLTVVNQAILNSGVPVNVQYENNASFGIQQRSFFGLRADYTVNKKLSLGATMERLSERPFFTKEDYGEDPIRNTMYGVDFNYHSNIPGVTRFLNRLPFYNTSTMSTINAYGEAAVLKPGHAPQIGKGSNGLIYIDDFEGSSSSVDLRFPFVSWALASTPAGNGLFPEASLLDSVDYGKNRAKLAWYNIEPILQDKTSPNNPLRDNKDELSDPRVRAVSTNELFPQRTTNITDVLTSTFDLAYYPAEPGPYNFTADRNDITADGKFQPNTLRQRWGGIMRSLDQTDFETSNIEFIEFWVQNPFIKDPTSSGGKLYIDLGNVSEDILKDGRRFYENGLNTPTQPAAVDSTTTWGRAPLNPIQITQAFSNDPNDRQYQDVGFDGLGDNGERSKRNNYLTQLAANYGTASAVYQKAFNDPSNDDYKWYRDASYDAAKTGILGRYKNYNNPQGNSPVAGNTSQFSPAATLYPDNEDLDHDNTLNETEEYYEYEVDLKPGMGVGLSKYITDQRVVTPHLANGSSTPETWYLFRIPVKDFTAKIGNIPDFKSIRFMRMYLTGFEDSVVMRFATLNLVRNQWRTFTYNLDTIGSYTPIPTNTQASFDLLSVNIEENSSRLPIPYKIPPGIERVQILSNNGVNLLQNEQSMSLRVHNLPKGDARAVFKTLNLDIRRYGELSMFVHAESLVNQPAITDGDLYAVIRIGQDFLTNYYEVRIPLKVTAPNAAASADDIWPTANNLDFALQDLVQLKLRRDASGQSISKIYREAAPGTTKSYAVMGNPNLAEVQGILIGIENAKTTNVAVNAEVWVDELRLSEIDEQGGWAALGRVDMQLADLGTMSVSANTYTHGWGTIEQQVQQRAFNDMTQFDGAINIDAGKLLPQKAGITIPLYASID
ncbi:MAG TPA: cell surface protein SprA, partial [Chitinophagaceae bacterium]|nr:cell surface protein SprA [Chitinophagaceae bacterium]